MLQGSHFLVSCPIDLFSSVTVELTEGEGVIAPDDIPKAETALRAAMRHFGLNGVGVRLTVASPLPRGKGMGSSTADVAGAVYALAEALGWSVHPDVVGRLAVAVEPTNSSLFPDLALFDHRHGSLCQAIGPPPPADVLVLDCGGEVDTVAYNRVDRTSILRELEPLAARSLALVREGVSRGDLGLIGEGATLSALAHQRVLPKAPLPEAIALGTELGAAGVSVAHSGTVIGVLFPPEPRDRERVSGRFLAQRSDLSALGWFSLIGGGCYRVGGSVASPVRHPCLSKRSISVLASRGAWPSGSLLK